jgi:hypothetical protein
MGQSDFIHQTGQLDRRQFLATAALAAAAGGVIPAPAAQALEAAGTVPAQPTEVDAWNMGLITAHRPEFTAAENRLRMAELRADIGNRFGLFEVRGRFVPKAGPRSKNGLPSSGQGGRFRQPEGIPAQDWAEIRPGRRDLEGR